MERFEKIAGIRNEVEAQCLQGELQERDIPHLLLSYQDTAYDGLFQFHGGWGHVEAPATCSAEILQILDDLRCEASTHLQDAPTDEDNDENDTDAG